MGDLAVIRFTIEGRPRPKERARTVHNRDRVRSFTPTTTVVAENNVAGAAGVARFRAGLRAPMKGPLSVWIRFTVPDRRRVDTDNLVKLILDGCNKVAYDDDSQVEGLSVVKRVDREHPMTEVVIGPTPAGHLEHLWSTAPAQRS